MRDYSLEEISTRSSRIFLCAPSCPLCLRGSNLTYIFIRSA